jgi:hypothetical protein
LDGAHENGIPALGRQRDQFDDLRHSVPHAQDFARESLHRRGGIGVAAEVRDKVGAGLRRPLLALLAKLGCDLDGDLDLGCEDLATARGAPFAY